MKRVHVNRTKIIKCEVVLCPKMQQVLEKTKDKASYCVPDWSGDLKFEVDGPDGKFVCDLNEMSCHCRKWDLIGISCKHGVSAMSFCALEPKNFFHHRDNYLKCYSNIIHPLNGSQMWPTIGLPPVLPPVYAVHPRQHQHKRMLEPDKRDKKRKGKGK